MTPFERWFSSDFAKALKDVPDDREVLSAGFSIRSASWDRRAAYLLWVERGRPEATWHAQTWPIDKPGVDEFQQRRYPEGGLIGEQPEVARPMRPGERITPASEQIDLEEAIAAVAIDPMEDVLG